MSNWNIYPAIDLRRGRVVRLMQGDPDRETEYATDALHVARRWQTAGAEWAHVVNLDAAFGEGGPDNEEALGRILSTGLAIQFGGGLRDLASIRRALELGVRRAVLGTVAVEQPALVEAALGTFGAQRIALAIDAQGGKVRTRGWAQTTTLAAVGLAKSWAEKGIRWAIFTDVARDGAGTGLNLEQTTELARASGLNIIASGGVASLDDVHRAHAAGLSGVIIGRALYEGQVQLEDALQIDAQEGGDVG